jgi:voltage-gated potassium channel Kch
MAADHASGERLVAWASGREQRKGLRPRDAAILIIIVWLLAIAIFGIVEHLVEPKTFPTVWLGMWWALVTVTTVGYGNVVPVSTAGRIIASFLLLGGLAFLTVIIAMITGGFVARYQRETSAAGDDHISQGMEQLSLRLRNCAPKSRNCAPKSRNCAHWATVATRDRAGRGE